MNNISGTKNCYGCGVCTLACPKKIIHLKQNKNGFYEPYIDNPSQCINCGFCLDVCSFKHTEIAADQEILKAYAGWSKCGLSRNTCSSGGVAYEVSRFLQGLGYKIVAARYNPKDNRVEHYIANTEEELELSKGSKYLQSYTETAFNCINKKEKYLVTGTPCQIDSFRRYIKIFKCEQNFVLLDFFCHGVPSKLMWDKYLAEKKKGLGDINKVLWRIKTQGWHNSWSMYLEGSNGSVESNLNQGDEFYQLFLSDTCLGKACYTQCKFKYQHSSADIRVGDLWGSAYLNNSEGVSAVVSYTEAGDKILRNIDCDFSEHTFDLVAEDQTRENPKITLTSYIIYKLLRLKFVSCRMLVKQLKVSKITFSLFYHLAHPCLTYNSLKQKLIR